MEISQNECRFEISVSNENPKQVLDLNSNNSSAEKEIKQEQQATENPKKNSSNKYLFVLVQNSRNRNEVENEEINWIDYLRTLDQPPDSAMMDWEDFIRMEPPRDVQRLDWYEFLKTEKPKRQMINWVEFLRNENPEEYQSCKKKLMDWLEFLRTEPKVNFNPNLIRWEDFLRQESPEEYNSAMHWVEFLRNNEPIPSPSKSKSQLEIESLRTPRALKVATHVFPIPEELIVHILSMVDIPSIGNFSVTCKHAKTLFHDALLWKLLYYKEYNKLPLSQDADPEYWQDICKKELPYAGKEWIAWSKKDKDPINARSGILNSLRKHLTNKKEMRIFLFGLENSGKSSILKNLPKAILNQKKDLLLDSTPTKGCNYGAILYKEIIFHILDVGGIHAKTQYSKWNKAFDFVDACGLVVDASKLVELGNVRKMIDFIVKHPVLSKKPVIVFANKKDQSPSLYAVVDIVCDVLNRYKEPFKQWFLQTTSCTNGDGLVFALEWLSEIAKE